MFLKKFRRHCAGCAGANEGPDPYYHFANTVPWAHKKEIKIFVKITLIVKDLVVGVVVPIAV